ncbi:hypothetical protein JW752_00095 [Candidatus Peregrinibacteria bacterium]|nr:hypothetical protein [Candidatus Peregrinibacteria bacterium]
MSTHFKYTLLVFFIAFLTFVAGYYVGQAGLVKTTPSSSQPTVSQPTVNVPAKKGSYEQGYQEALDFARQKLAEEGAFEPPRNLTAVVKTASGQNVVVEFNASLLDPFAEGMATKTIVVSGETKLFERVEKDEEQYKKEYAEYEKAMQAYETALAGAKTEEGLEEPREPQEYEEKVLAVSDLLPGDRVRVIAKVIEMEATEDGKEAPMVSPFASDKVEAAEVRLYSRPEPEPEKELPTPMEEEMKEASEELLGEPVAEEVEEVTP